MELLKQRIRAEGIVRPGNVLMVNSFLNHQMDMQLIDEIAKEFIRRFDGVEINKVLTIEASGIGIAGVVALRLGCPMVFAKKSKTTNVGDDVYCAKVESFTHGTVSDVIVDRRFLSKDDKLLIIDDFLANGKALEGLFSIAEQAGAQVQGVGIVIEKGFQGAGDRIRAAGYDLQSLAIVESMDAAHGTIVFRD